MSRKHVAATLALLGVVAFVIFFALFADVYVMGESGTARVVGHEQHGSGTESTCAPVLLYEVDGQAAPRR